VIKHYWKMKQRQRYRLSSIGRKCDTVRRREDIGWRRGDAGRGKGGDDADWVDANLTWLKMKKIHVIDSTGINGP
jgi:hypothetical protein